MDKRAREALVNTVKLETGHWNALCATRAGVLPSAGSYYPDTPSGQVAALIMTAEWEEYTHPAVQSPAQAFRAEIPGRINILPIEAVGEDADLVLFDAHHGHALQDEHFVECECTREMGFDVPVVHSTLLIGPRATEGDKIVDPTPIVWTFFPGDPVSPSKIPAAGNHGRRVSKKEAVQLGIRYVKVSRG